MTTQREHPFLSLTMLPEAVKPLLRKLMQGDLLSLGVLRGMVENYRRVIHGAARRGKPVNLALGEGIAVSLFALIARIDERTSDDDRRLVQAAARYFVIENDGMGHDLAHEDGFFDDARVVNALMRWFGRDDLMLRLPQAADRRRPPPPPRVARA
jgi:hypothetical protein